MKKEYISPEQCVVVLQYKVELLVDSVTMLGLDDPMDNLEIEKEEADSEFEVR